MKWLLHSIPLYRRILPRPKPFPLFKLPIVAQREVYRSKKFTELVKISNCSKASARNLKAFASLFILEITIDPLQHRLDLRCLSKSQTIYLEQNSFDCIWNLDILPETLTLAESFTNLVTRVHFKVHPEEIFMNHVFNWIRKNSQFVKQLHYLYLYPSSRLFIAEALELDYCNSFVFDKTLGFIEYSNTGFRLYANYENTLESEIWELMKFRSLVVKGDAISVDCLQRCVKRWVECGPPCDNGTTLVAPMEHGINLEIVLDGIHQFRGLGFWNHEKFATVTRYYEVRQNQKPCKARVFEVMENGERLFVMCIEREFGK